jgi:hypothetical protein
MHRYTSREPSLHHPSQRSSNITLLFAATVPSFQAQHVATPHRVSVHFSDTSHQIILTVPASCWGRCRWRRFGGAVQRCVSARHHSSRCCKEAPDWRIGVLQCGHQRYEPSEARSTVIRYLSSLRGTRGAWKMAGVPYRLLCLRLLVLVPLPLALIFCLWSGTTMLMGYEEPAHCDVEVDRGAAT